MIIESKIEGGALKIESNDTSIWARIEIIRSMVQDIQSLVEGKEFPEEPYTILMDTMSDMAATIDDLENLLNGDGFEHLITPNEVIS